MTLRRTQIVKLKPWNKEKSLIFFCRLNTRKEYIYSSPGGLAGNRNGYLVEPDCLLAITSEILPWKIMTKPKTKEEEEKNILYLHCPSPNEFFFTKWHQGYIILDKTNESLPKLIPASFASEKFDYYHNISRVYKLLVKPNIQ